MSIKQLYKTQALNILIALLIGIFVIFPDIIRILDTDKGFEKDLMQHELEEVFQDPFLVPDVGPGKDFGPPPGDRDGRNGPPNHHEENLASILSDLLFFVILSWGLLLINNPSKQHEKLAKMIRSSRTRNLLIIGVTFILCYLGIFLNSIIHMDDFSHFTPFPWYMNGILLFKGLFVFVSVVLFGQLFRLINKQQYMILENEKLKTESLQNRFEALSAQISPHFFFNSLNSLSGLIRENENKKALRYIYEISSFFRHILQGKWDELVSLKEEMDFLEAYLYLLNIKYDDKLEVSINIHETKDYLKKLPALSLQPLVENITKHNIISAQNPMHIQIFLKNEETLVVENIYQPLQNDVVSSGTGLSNLNKRYKMLTKRECVSYIENHKFVVELPLITKE